MDMKTAKKLRGGEIVKEAYDTTGGQRIGLVLTPATYVLEEHYANVLGAKKHARYDVYVHWLPRTDGKDRKYQPVGIKKLQCWEIMLAEA